MSPAASLRAFVSRIWNTVKPTRTADEFDEEAQAHLALLTERFRRVGMAEQDARFAALRQFGNVTATKEYIHTHRRFSHFENFVQDLQYALRQLQKEQTFSLAVVLTIALGLGANTAVFAVVDAVILRPLPYAQPDRLVSIQYMDRRSNRGLSDFSYPNFFDFRTENKAFEHLVSYRSDEFAIVSGQRAFHVDGEIVSWDLFQMLQVRPELGRSFLPGDEKPGTHGVIISDELWRTRFRADPKVLETPVTINGMSFMILGITPRDFRFPADHPRNQLWTTLAEDAVSAPDDQPLTSQRGAIVISVLGRQKAGISLSHVQSQMDAIAEALSVQYPDHNKNLARTLIRPELERLTGKSRPAMLILLGAVLLVLLVACANIANLLLSRSAEREREFAVRAALGASAGRLVHQLFVESLVLSSLGTLSGMLLALAFLRLIVPLAENAVPRIAEARLDGSVTLFAIALAVLTTILFGLTPAFRLVRAGVSSSIRSGALNIISGYDRLRNVLVIAQIALGLILLSAAGLLVNSFLYLERRSPGFRPDHLLTFNLDIPSELDRNTSKQIAFSHQLLDRLSVLPGVRSAAAAMPLPLSGNRMSISFDIEERRVPPSERPSSDIAIVTPAFFQTMGIALLQGRYFTDHDDASAAPVLIVNKAFSDRFFPGETVIGKRIESGATASGSSSHFSEIVGVVENARQSPLGLSADPIYYFPHQQMPWGIGSIVLRTSVPPLGVASTVRNSIHSLHNQIPIFDLQTMEHFSQDAIAGPRMHVLLLGSFAVTALLLMLVGLYGVLAYSVLQRTREIGVRISLGASRGMIVFMVLRQALLMIAFGMAIGLGGSIAGGQAIKSILYGVDPLSPGVLTAVCSLLAAAGMLAAYIPARRAGSIDPMHALRSE